MRDIVQENVAFCNGYTIVFPRSITEKGSYMLQSDIDKCTLVRTTGTYTQTKINTQPRGILDKLLNTPGVTEVTDKISFDTLNGDEVHLTDEWEKHYEGSFEIAGLYFYVAHDPYQGSYPCGYLVLVGCAAMQLHGTVFEIQFSNSVDTPQATISFIHGSPKSNRYSTYGYEVQLTFKDREQFSAYTDTLEDEDVVVTKVKSVR